MPVESCGHSSHGGSAVVASGAKASVLGIAELNPTVVWGVTLRWRM